MKEVDKFKDFMQENMASLDDKFPSEGLFNAVIQRKRQRNYVRRLVLFTKVAAACMVLGVLGSLLFPKFKEHNNGRQVVSGFPKAIMGDTVKESHLGTALSEDTNRILKGSVSFPVARTKVKRNNNDIPLIIKQQNDKALSEIEKTKVQPVFLEEPDYFSFFISELNSLSAEQRKLEFALLKDNGQSPDLITHFLQISQARVLLLKTLQSQIQVVNERVLQGQGSEPLPVVYLNI